MIIKNNDQEDQKSFPNQKVILEIMILTGFQCDLCFFHSSVLPSRELPQSLTALWKWQKLMEWIFLINVFIQPLSSPACCY